MDRNRPVTGGETTPVNHDHLRDESDDEDEELISDVQLAELRRRVAGFEAGDAVTIDADEVLLKTYCEVRRLRNHNKMDG